MRLLTFLLLLSLTLSSFAQNQPKVIHVYVALCDNASQGIVPVPEKLGNGDDPYNNLYWGAYFGVKSFFKRSGNWKALNCIAIDDTVMERCVFQHKASGTYLIADAYRGTQIKKCIQDFVNATAGIGSAPIYLADSSCIDAGGAAQLLAYTGHDGLMEFSLDYHPAAVDTEKRDAIILACISKEFFNEPLRISGANPLVWTTGLMAPEAYTLEHAIEGWIAGENNQAIRMRAAQAYHKYQKCGINGAKNLLVNGF